MSRNAVPVIARFWVICFAFALIPFGLPAVFAGVLSLRFLAFVALLVAVGFNRLQWLGHRPHRFGQHLSRDRLVDEPHRKRR